MSQVITFENYLPPARYDSLPWTDAEIYEATTATGSGTLIDTITLSPVDADPSDPAYRDFTTEQASSTDGLWYWIVFKDADGDASQPTDPVQNISSTYVSVNELLRKLDIRNASDEEQAAAARILTMATIEINREIDRTADNTLDSSERALAEQVCLQRSIELWSMQGAPFNIAGAGIEFGSIQLARNSWDKYAYTLAPLKEQFGLA